MTDLLCPACGQGRSEFDSRCPACGAVLPLPSSPELSMGAGRDPLLGLQVSHFRVVRPLGRGGMGAVYLAVDLELEREVALKFLAPRGGKEGNEEIRFRREAQAAAALDHPNIGTVYEVGESAGRRFIAMAYYDGETLARRLANAPGHRLPVDEATSIAGQLASALEAAHETGVVHRDLKPENVMILPGGGPGGRLKLLDFGLARRADLSGLTEAGVAVGTAAYMAPEQLRGEEAGPAADLWAWGAVLHEMLAGERPFGGERKGMVHAILHEDPAPLPDLRPEVPAALAVLARRCLGKEPGERPAGAAELLAELAAAGLWEAGGSGSFRGSAAGGLAERRARRRFRPRAAAAATAALLLGLAAYRLSRPPAPPLYVAVLKPVVRGPAPLAERDLTAANVQGAVLRALAGLRGVAALDPSQVGAVTGSPAEVAKAVAAGEVVTAEAACADELCQLRLRRLDGADGRVLWMDSLQLPTSRPRLFAEGVEAAVRRGYPDRAARSAKTGPAVEEEDFRRYLELRRRLAEPGELPALLRELGALRGRAPGFIEAFVLEAAVARRLYSDTGDRKYLEHGIEVARQARELAPEDPRPLASLFDLDLEAGHLDEAEGLLGRLEALDPASTLLRRGQLAERRGEGEKALELTTAAVRLQPSWRSLYLLANMEYRLGRLDGARRHLAELLERSPGNVDGLRTLAQIELLNDPARAVELLRQLVARRPDPASLTNLGLAYLLLRRYGEAEASFRQGLALAPHDPSAALNLADCLHLLGRDAEARRLYRGIVESVARVTGPADRGESPALASWPLLSVKAQALAHLGEGAAAVEAIQAALRLTPGNAQLAFEASLVYALVGESASAVVHARRAAELGLDRRWFAFPWFDPLRSDPAFAALLTPARR